uniref:Leucine rich repeat protein n=1 Tax=Schistocephalus solidus TaxID=70667 RepID=A0A183T0P9_SCHSO
LIDPEAYHELIPLENSGLVHLSLRFSKLSTEGIHEVAKRLGNRNKWNNSIISLDLTGCRITDLGMCYIAETLTKFFLTDDELALRRILQGEYLFTETQGRDIADGFSLIDLPQKDASKLAAARKPAFGVHHHVLFSPWGRNGVAAEASKASTHRGVYHYDQLLPYNEARGAEGHQLKSQQPFGLAQPVAVAANEDYTQAEINDIRGFVKKFLKSPRNAEIRTRLLSKIEQDPDTTLQTLTAKCQWLKNQKNDSAIVEQPSSSLAAISVRAFPHTMSMSLHKSKDSTTRKPQTAC